VATIRRAVSAGFPAGLGPLETRVREIEASVAAGAREPLATVLAEQDEVNALWYVGPAAGYAMIERVSTGNLKQTWTNHGKARNWFDPVQGEGPEFPRHATQVKNIWVPYGE
jgi:aldehyde dehydrogenase (NAD+)